jgi:hypothetical protein
LSLAYGVRAVTRYQSAQDTFDVGIEVIIPKDSAVSDLLAIPYVFAHEIICHAYQKAGLGKDVLCERGDDCPFTEGWMDELAFNSLCELLQKYRNNAPALIRAMPSKIYEQSQKVFDSRYYVERDRRAFSRATGRDALRSVEQLLWIWHDHPYFSRYATTPDLIVNEVLFEFSFLLNILADDNQAEDVVFYTSSILPFSESVPNFHSRNLDYLKALISFLDQQNLNLFLLDLNKQFRSL